MARLCAASPKQVRHHAYPCLLMRAKDLYRQGSATSEAKIPSRTRRRLLRLASLSEVATCGFPENGCLWFLNRGKRKKSIAASYELKAEGGGSARRNYFHRVEHVFVFPTVGPGMRHHRRTHFHQSDPSVMPNSLSSSITPRAACRSVSPPLSRRCATIFARRSIRLDPTYLRVRPSPAGLDVPSFGGDPRRERAALGAYGVLRESL